MENRFSLKIYLQWIINCLTPVYTGDLFQTVHQKRLLKGYKGKKSNVFTLFLNHA